MFVCVKCVCVFSNALMKVVHSFANCSVQCTIFFPCVRNVLSKRLDHCGVNLHYTTHFNKLKLQCTVQCTTMLHRDQAWKHHVQFTPNSILWLLLNTIIRFSTHIRTQTRTGWSHRKPRSSLCLIGLGTRGMNYSLGSISPAYFAR